MPFILGDPTQTSPEIHVDDIGTRFIVTVYDQDSELINLSSATSLKIKFQSPSNEDTEKTALLYTDGTDGKMYYDLQTGLIDEAGTWKYQGIITFASGTWRTNVVDFTVYANI